MIKTIKPPRSDTYVVYPYLYGSTFWQKELLVGKAYNKVYRSYLLFDLTGLEGYEIRSATLSLYLFFNSSPVTSKSLKLFRVISSWDEKFLNWNNQPFVALPEEGEAIITGEVNTFIDFNVTNLVRNWLIGDSANFGVLLRMANEIQNNLIGFKSREEGYSDYWPKLTIHYIRNLNNKIDQKFIVESGINWNFLPAIDVLTLNYSFIIENIGNTPGEVVLEVGADGISWVRDSEVKLVLPGQILILIPNVITRYARVAYRGSKFKIYFQGRSF
ncbi:DNRLRE domain-containing protein [Carboxydothermus ferrireducens]|uniref:TGF-beta propeptide n=1 Tax=Carboxydothermus ferrireducens DSM 11255 TaxID=1119529 RepID=A0ABX2R8Z0_9THEO|nr:DNRLRE domain-containing protein [Carboxydothermus ferrireducens]NYE57651.1 hypothetical protein [Carboxydothermus ferrireducens DSM 11255]